MTSNLGKYLGVPIHHHVLEKVKMKLTGWKTNMLSLAGCETLIQRTTAAIPIYSMQKPKLPLGLSDDIEKVNMTFLCGGIEEKKRLHSVNWESVCNSKEEGVLGIRRIR